MIHCLGAEAWILNLHSALFIICAFLFTTSCSKLKAKRKDFSDKVVQALSDTWFNLYWFRYWVSNQHTPKIYKYIHRCSGVRKFLVQPITEDLSLQSLLPNNYRHTGSKSLHNDYWETATPTCDADSYSCNYRSHRQIISPKRNAGVNFLFVSQEHDCST